MTLRANWSYPTLVKFGAGRIAELAEHCRAAGLKKPLLVTDKALAALPITLRALDLLEAGALAGRCSPMSIRTRTKATWRPDWPSTAPEGMTGSSASAAARRSTSAR